MTTENKALLKNVVKTGPSKYVHQTQIQTYNHHHNSKNKKTTKKFKSKYNTTNYTRPKFSSGGEIRSEWVDLHHQITINQIDKSEIKFNKETLAERGAMPEYNRGYEPKVSVKTPAHVKRTRDAPKLTEGAFKDPYLLNVVFNGEFPEDKKIVVMDDVVFTTLCTIHKTYFPFNIKFTKQGNKYAFNIDPADQSAAFASLQTLNENINGHLPEDETIVGKLALEATLLTQNLASLVAIPESAKEGSVVRKEIEDEDLKSFMEENEMEFDVDETKYYKYVKIELNNEYLIFIRTKVDAYEVENGVQKPILIRGLMNIKPNDWIKQWVQKSD